MKELIEDICKNYWTLSLSELLSKLHELKALASSIPPGGGPPPPTTQNETK